MSWIIDIIVDFSIEHSIWNRAYIYSGDEKPLYSYVDMATVFFFFGAGGGVANINIAENKNH